MKKNDAVVKLDKNNSSRKTPMPPACQLADMNLRDQEKIIADIDKQIENENVLAK